MADFQLTSPNQGTYHPGDQIPLAVSWQIHPSELPGGTGFGRWQLKHEQASSWATITENTMLKQVSGNPFAVDAQANGTTGTAEATNVTGNYKVRMEVLDSSQSQVLFTSPEGSLHVDKIPAGQRVT